MTEAIRDPITVMVIEDDPESMSLITEALAGLHVVAIRDPHQALRLLESTRCDVVVTAIGLAEMSGLELLDRLRQWRTDLPVILVTAFTEVDYVLAALRGGADEYLHKPLDPGALREAVTRLGHASRERAAARRRRVLAIGAHPDDVEVGIGGLLAAHTAHGDEVAILTLTHGERSGAELEAESREAARLLGAALYLEDLPDAQVAAGEPTLGTIQRVIAEVDPHAVYTHSLNDFHQDHRAVNRATMVAARRVRTVACYQSPSATVEFHPNRFVGIDGFVDAKLALLDCFASQVGASEHLDSDLIVATARYWSRHGGGHHAEPLEVVRDRVGALGTGADARAAVDAPAGPSGIEGAGEPADADATPPARPTVADDPAALTTGDPIPASEILRDLP